MRISDWSSDVCSSDLVWLFLLLVHRRQAQVLEVEAEVRARRDRHHPRLDDLPVRIERNGQERIRVQDTVAPAPDERSEERRAGTGSDSTCRSRRSPDL